MPMPDKRTISDCIRAQEHPTKPEMPKTPYPTSYAVIDEEAATEREIVKAVEELDAPDPDLAVVLPLEALSKHKVKR